MSKRKNTKKTIGIIIVIAVLAIIAGFSGIFSIPFSDYGILDSFDSGIDPASWTANNVDAKEGKVFFPRLPFSIHARNNARLYQTVQGSLTSNFNIGADEYEFFVGGSGTGGLSVSCRAPKLIVTTGTCAAAVNGQGTLFNIYVSDINKTKAILAVDGSRTGCEFDPTNAKISMDILDSNTDCETEFSIDEIRSKKKFRTTFDPATESLYRARFDGPTTVSISSFKIPPMSFSLANPVIIASAVEKGVDSTAEPLIAWNKLESVDVPPFETWEVLYIGERRYNVNNCDYAVDSETKECLSRVIIENECPDDQVRDDDGVCIDALEFSCDKLNGMLVNGSCHISQSIDSVIDEFAPTKIEVTPTTSTLKTQTILTVTAILLALAVILFFVVKRKK